VIQWIANLLYKLRFRPTAEEHDEAFGQVIETLHQHKFMNVDERSAGNIAKLHTKLQPLASAFMSRIRTELGDFRITSGYRSYEEQNALYAQGRTKPGKRVTNARGGYSNHNFALAFDITLFKDGKPVWESPLYLSAAKIGKAMGLDCGAFWTSFKDEPHFGYMHGKTLAQLRELKAAGKDVLL
jgi:peptidoglycan L-alanyl-D-glutamate endopeptidase CwlK